MKSTMKPNAFDFFTTALTVLAPPVMGPIKAVQAVGALAGLCKTEVVIPDGVDADTCNRIVAQQHDNNSPGARTRRFIATVVTCTWAYMNTTLFTGTFLFNKTENQGAKDAVSEVNTVMGVIVAFYFVYVGYTKAKESGKLQQGMELLSTVANVAKSQKRPKNPPDYQGGQK